VFACSSTSRNLRGASINSRQASLRRRHPAVHPSTRAHLRPSRRRRGPFPPCCIPRALLSRRPRPRPRRLLPDEANRARSDAAAAAAARGPRSTRPRQHVEVRASAFLPCTPAAGLAPSPSSAAAAPCSLDCVPGAGALGVVCSSHVQLSLDWLGLWHRLEDIPCINH
jgi:hypothetical protein